MSQATPDVQTPASQESNPCSLSRPLPPDQQRTIDQEAYRLRVEEHLTLREVASKMGCHPDTAAQRIRRAEARIAKRLASTIAHTKAGQHGRYLALYDKLLTQARDTIGLNPDLIDSALSILDRIDRLWGLDRSPPPQPPPQPPPEPAPNVFSKNTTIYQGLDPALLKLIDREPSPAPLPQAEQPKALPAMLDAPST